MFGDYGSIIDTLDKVPRNDIMIVHPTLVSQKYSYPPPSNKSQNTTSLFPMTTRIDTG